MEEINVEDLLSREREERYAYEAALRTTQSKIKKLIELISVALPIQDIGYGCWNIVKTIIVNKDKTITYEICKIGRGSLTVLRKTTTETKRRKSFFFFEGTQENVSNETILEYDTYDNVNEKYIKGVIFSSEKYHEMFGVVQRIFAERVEKKIAEYKSFKEASYLTELIK